MTQREKVEGRPALEISDDRTRLRMHFPGTRDSSRSFAMEYTSGEIDQILYELATVRAHMANEHPLELRELQGAQGVVNPACRLSTDDATGDVVLSLRHPGLGWLHFLLSDDVALRLGRMLQAQAEAAGSRKH
jgi:hypothetical protein